MKKIHHLINGAAVESTSGRTSSVWGVDYDHAWVFVVDFADYCSLVDTSIDRSALSVAQRIGERSARTRTREPRPTRRRIR